MSVTLRTLRRCLLFLIAVTACGCAPSPVIPPGEVDISMRRGDRVTFLPSTIHGKRGYFVFDTGCSTTALSNVQFRDPSRWRRSLRVETGSAGGRIVVKQETPPILDVGPFRLNNLSAVWLADLSSVSEAVGVRIWGAIGSDCFLSRIVQIDPDARRISLLPAEVAASRDWGARSECQLRGTWMLIPVLVGGQKVWCVIDTGSDDAVSIPRAVFDKVVVPGACHDDIAATAAGMADYSSAVVPSVQMLGRQVAGVSLSVTDNEYGSVGMAVLSRFVLTIDYPGKCVYARPSRTFNYRDPPERNGIGWVRRDGKVVVEFLEPGGAAERAGARLGDVMLSINGRASDSFEFLDEISDVFSQTPPAYRVIALRGGRKVKYAFSPE